MTSFNTIKYSIYFSQIEVSIYCNHILSQLFIGLVYLLRQNNDDIEKAAYYFKLGADKKCADSQYNLGMLLYEFNDNKDCAAYFF